MKIFVLEDDPERVKWLKENLSDKVEMELTDLADTAMKLLRENEYDCIFLDHDLGGEQMVKSSVWNTGATVARMVHETKNKNRTVIVHSWNPSGAKIMIDSMRDNGVKCFYFYFGSQEFVSAIMQVNQKAS